MGGLLKFLFQIKLLRPIIEPVIRPLLRLLMGFIAIPIFRFICRRIFRLQELDQELERDLEQWFKASLVLLAATKNMELYLFGELVGKQDDLSNPWITGLRIMMAIGVTELMPDQGLFSLIHPGPPPLRYDRKLGLKGCVREQCYPFFKGLVCQHLNRSSPVFAILSTIFLGPTGWICYFLAITQYLIIGLVTSRDRIHDVLSRFDEQMAMKRRQIEEEFHLEQQERAVEADQAARVQSELTEQQPENPPRQMPEKEKL